MESDVDLAVFGCVSLIVGPEGVTCLVTIFSEATQHDHHLALELPHHPPQVTHCVLEGTLSRYVGIATFVALHTDRHSV